MFQQMKATKFEGSRRIIPKKIWFIILMRHIFLYISVIHDVSSLKVSETPSSKHSTIQRELKRKRNFGSF